MNSAYVDGVLDVNRRVTIVVLEGHYSGRYPSRVEDMGQPLLLAAPTHKGVIVRLDAGTPICVEVVAEDGVYAFDTYIDSIILEPIPVIGVVKPESFSRIQRREFVRVDVMLSVKYRPLKPALQESSKYQEAHIVNLSGGGARIVTWYPPEDEDLDMGSWLELEFELPGGNEIEAKAVIIRISDETTEKGVFYKLAVEFAEIDQRKQDAIARHVLECQYEMRRKGLL